MKFQIKKEGLGYQSVNLFFKTRYCSVFTLPSAAFGIGITVNIDKITPFYICLVIGNRNFGISLFEQYFE